MCHAVQEAGAPYQCVVNRKNYNVHTYGPAQMQHHLLRVQAIKNSLIKGRGTHSAHKCSSQTKQDECSQVKWVPRPLISKFFLSLELSQDDVAFEWYCSSVLLL